MRKNSHSANLCQAGSSYPILQFPTTCPVTVTAPALRACYVTTGSARKYGIRR